MSTSPQIADPLWSVDNRRALPRRRVSDLAYVGYGADNGGILLDLSEGGLSCQVVGPVVQGDVARVTFVLPGTKLAIEADGRVIWRNTTKKGGGLAFLSLAEKSRQAIRKWVLAEESAELWIEEGTAVLDSLAGDIHDKPDIQFVPPTEKEPAYAGTPASSVPVVHPLGSVLSHQAGVFPRTITAPQPARAIDSPGSINSSRARPAIQHGFEQIIAERPSHRPLTFAVIGVVVLLGAGISQAGRLRSWVEALKTGSKLTSQPAVAPEPTPPNPPFQVEAVGVDNQRWILSNDNSVAPELQSDPQRVARQVPRPSSSAPVFASPAEKLSGRSTGLQRPSAPSVPVRTGELAEPEVEADHEAGIRPVVLPSVTLNFPPPPPVPVPAEVNKPAGFQAPLLVHRVEPQYSPLLRTAGVQGKVQLRAVIGKDGVPKSISRVGGDPRLSESAENAIRQWRYKPASDGGEAVEAPLTISVEFRIK